MELDELKEVWQQQENGEKGGYTNADLHELIQTKMGSLQQKIRSRDRLEIAACILLIVIFGYVFYVSQAHWIRLGATVIMLSSCFIIYMLKSAQKERIEHPVSVDMPIDEHLQQELDRVERQKILLSNITWWYIAPLTTGLLFITLGWNATWGSKSIYMSCVLLIGIGVWFYNQRKVRKKFAPLKKELEEAMEFIEKRE